MCIIKGAARIGHFPIRRCVWNLTFFLDASSACSKIGVLDHNRFALCHGHGVRRGEKTEEEDESPEEQANEGSSTVQTKAQEANVDLV